jgi:hypothetical protein
MEASVGTLSGRPQGHDSAFAKLGFPDEEQITTEVGIGQRQPNYFAYSESQAV